MVSVMQMRTPIVISGDPDEEVGRQAVRVGDVARTLEVLGFGRHTNEEISACYVEVCEQAGREPGQFQTVARIMAAMGCGLIQIYSSRVDRYVRGRMVNPERLSQRWPRLLSR